MPKKELSYKEYLDCDGEVIKPGDIILWQDGSIDKVYKCGDRQLGVCATNPAYLKRHPDTEITYYPLDNFARSEYQLYKRRKDAEKDEGVKVCK